MSEDELSLIKAAALNAGMAVGAWLRGLGVDSAGRLGWELAGTRSEVIGQLLRMRVDLVEVVHAADGDVARRHAREALGRVDALIGRAVENRER